MIDCSLASIKSTHGERKKEGKKERKKEGRTMPMKS
jgi:hypothetical protein